MQVEGGSQRSLPVGDRVALGAALALVGIQALANNEGARGVDARNFDPGAVALLVLASGLAALGRRAPAVGALGNVAVIVFWHRIGYTSGLVNVPYLVSFYLLGATGDRRRQLGVGGITVTSVALAMLAAGEETAASAAAAIGWTLAAVLFGELTHSRRALLAEYEARALRAEADRDAEAERRVARSRLEIARDLHDVLAHTVSVMTVQAGVGQDALARGADGAASALGTIRAAGREAMDEIAALVAVLRDGAGAASTAPAPGLDRLADLVAATRAGGVEVVLDVDVAREAASGVAELTAYRVVQESLTNVVRHAAARTATVVVRVEGQELVVEICDDGDGQPVAERTEGFGLRGMRERVESAGGRLQAGPNRGGGWQVRATIPLERPRAP